MRTAIFFGGKLIPGPERDFFNYKQGELHCENVSFSSIARKVPTPFFVYSRAALENSFNSIKNAFGDLGHSCLLRRKKQQQSGRD